MHFYVLGGSGQTGLVLLEEALSRGHTVTTLSRNPSKLPQREGLTTCKGTPYQKEDIESSFLTGGLPSAVLVTLNSSDKLFGKPKGPPDTLERSNTNVVEVMQRHGVRKIVIMQVMGTGDSYAELSFMMRQIMQRTVIGYLCEEHTNTDKMIRARSSRGEFEWVMLRPPMLKGVEKRPIRDMGDRGKGVGIMSSVSRGSVASFMVDAAETNQWDGRTPVIMN